MGVTRMYDWLFADQMFRRNERGETVFYPNGPAGRGYLVPPEREPEVRSGVRRLSLVSLIGTLVVIVLVPRTVEWWLAVTIPLTWFIAGALVALVIGFGLTMRALSRLTAGLAPASP
jgi:drug/metabolite transporter (DMT)-like permease